VTGWKDALSIGHAVAGDEDAPITVVALVDLQCPACAGFHQGFKKVLAERREQLRVIYVHYPLEYHRMAVPAANAAECAARVGAFVGWVEVVYQKQDSLGIKSWESYARSAGITDTSAVARCAASQAPVQTVAEGIEYGRRLGVTAIPTILVNGWRYRQPPDRAALEQAFDALLQDKKPRRS
jgi:protein-disulfide isomerase